MGSAKLFGGGQTIGGGSGSNTVEISFVTTVSEAGDWQGTIVGDQYDSSGSLISEYVANVILIEPTVGVYVWNLIYELPIDNTGNPVKSGPTSPVQPDPAVSRLQWGVPFVQQRSAAIAVFRALKQPHIQNVGFLGGWGAWGKCTGAWSAGAAAGCFAGSL